MCIVPVIVLHVALVNALIWGSRPRLLSALGTPSHYAWPHDLASCPPELVGGPRRVGPVLLLSVQDLQTLAEARLLTADDEALIPLSDLAGEQQCGSLDL